MDRPIKLEELDYLLRGFYSSLDDVLLERSKLEASGDDKKFYNKELVACLDFQTEELCGDIKFFNALTELVIKGYPVLIEESLITQ